MKIVDGMYGVTSLEAAAKNDRADVQRAKNSIPKVMSGMQNNGKLHSSQKAHKMPHHAALKGKVC